MLRSLSILLVCLTMASTGCANRGAPPPRGGIDLQQEVMSWVLGQRLPKHNGYYWPKASDPKAPDDTLFLGTAENVDYLGKQLSKVRENGGTHCVGVSWQVGVAVLKKFYRQSDPTGAIAGMSADEMIGFIDKWFIRLERLGTSTLARPEEMGAVHALTSSGLGRRIAFKNARPGDFVQFWRKDGSGHSCIFLHWIYDASGAIIGANYWGSQPQTEGIGTDTEYFAPQSLAIEPERLLDRDRFYIGRLEPTVHR